MSAVRAGVFVSVVLGGSQRAASAEKGAQLEALQVRFGGVVCHTAVLGGTQRAEAADKDAQLAALQSYV